MLQWHEPTPLVKQIIDLGGIVAGGYAHFLATAEDYAYGDIDIFTNNAKDHQAIAELFERLDCSESTTLNSRIYRLDFEDEIYNLVNYDHRKFSNVADLVNQFDFSICQVGLDKNGLYGTTAYCAYRYSQNVYFAPCYEIANPVEEMQRLFKYQRKGFNVPRSEIVKVLDAWAGLDTLEKVVAVQSLGYAT